MDNIKDAFYLYSGTNVCNNTNYKQINLNTINNCLCFYAHEDSEIRISLLSGTTYYSNNNSYSYVCESDIINLHNQGYDNQYSNNYIINGNGSASGSPYVQVSKYITVSSNASNYVTINLSCGDRLYLWQKNIISNSQYNKLNITGTGKYSVSGDLRSLISCNLTVSTYPTGAFASLFQNNTALYDASGLILPEPDTLPIDCFRGMFENCTNLRYPSKLPTSILNDYCYCDMFRGCTNLIVAPDIPITGFYNDYANENFDSMFYGCTSLIQAPELDFNIINGINTYMYMFKNCTNLILGPSEIKCSCDYGCMGMFTNCINLKRASKLPNINLSQECYKEMFQNCTSLEEVPELPATILAKDCYANMFYGCSKLKYIKADFLTNYYDSSNKATTNWVDGVASEGLFYKNADGHFNETGVNGIPTGWTVRTEFPISDGLILWLDGYQIHCSTSTNTWYKSMCVPSLQNNWSIRFANTATTLCNGKCMKITDLNGGAHTQYSSSGVTANNPFYNIGMTADSSMTCEMFIKLDTNQTESSTPTSSLHIGGMTYATGSSQYRWQWNIDGNGYLYIYTPLTGSTWTDVLHGAKSVTDGRYHHVVFQKDGTTIKFYIDGKLDTEATNSPWKLNVNSGSFMVGIGRYDALTSTGTSVKSHPGEYYSLSIYNRALSEDEIKLNYKILNERYNENYDYNYFYFENLGDSNNYIKLTKVGTNGPTLEYSYDKNTWTSWTYTSSNVIFNTYKKIYFRGTNTYISYNDTSNYVTFSSGQNVNVGGDLLSLLSTDLNTFSTTRTYIFANLFKDMTTLISAKNLHMPPSLYNYCYHQMFRGCTNLVRAPKLWTTNTLHNGSYDYMFYGCTSLTAAPALWCNALISQCYNYMFYGCSSLKYIKALFTTAPSTSYTNNWVSGVASAGTFVKSNSATWATTGASWAPTNWTIVKVDY